MDSSPTSSTAVTLAMLGLISKKCGNFFELFFVVVVVAVFFCVVFLILFVLGLRVFFLFLLYTFTDK